MKVISDINARNFLKRINQKMLLVICLLASGCVLRIWQYAANRSLWLDEAMLALNLTRRTFVGLAQPLDYNQAAPLFFLFIQKANIIVFGNSEFALRLFPLLAGILSLFLMYEAAKKYLRGTAVYIALALFCFSSTLIYYSSENKQYSSDVMCALIVLLAGLPCLQDAAKPKEYMLLAIAGFVAMWVSHPIVFVLAGVGFVAVLMPLVRKNWQKLLLPALACLLWMINMAFLYYITLRYTAANSMFANFWKGGFMPIPPWSNWGWFSNTLVSIFQNPLGLSFVAVSAALLLIGCISILLRKWAIGLVLIITILTTLVASGLQKYPFRERLVLFLVPTIFLLIAEGIEGVRDMLANRSRIVAFSAVVALALLLLVQPVVSAINGLQNPDMREHIRPIVEYVSKNKQASDLVYLHYGAKPAFLYYAPSHGFKDGDYRVGVRAQNEPEKYLQDIYTLKGKGRVWFIFGHIYSKDKIDARLYYMIHLNSMGKKIDEFNAPGAVAYLYDLRGGTRLR